MATWHGCFCYCDSVIVEESEDGIHVRLKVERRKSWRLAMRLVVGDVKIENSSSSNNDKPIRLCHKIDYLLVGWINSFSSVRYSFHLVAMRNRGMEETLLNSCIVASYTVILLTKLFLFLFWLKLICSGPLVHWFEIHSSGFPATYIHRADNGSFNIIICKTTKKKIYSFRKDIYTKLRIISLYNYMFFMKI